jgi:hypothetical protein
MVPPVWPRPRPLTIGTATPAAATSGASSRLTLSPTPPVECVLQHPARVAHRQRQRRGLGCGHAIAADGHQEGAELGVAERAVDDARDEVADLFRGEVAAVALLRDQSGWMVLHGLPWCRTRRCAAV